MFVFDSHEYIEDLISKGSSKELAEAHARQFKKIIESDLATKNDLQKGLAEKKADSPISTNIASQHATKAQPRQRGQ